MTRRRRTSTGEKIVGMVAVVFCAWGVFAVFNWFGESQIEHAKSVQAKIQVDMARAHREAEARSEKVEAEKIIKEQQIIDTRRIIEQQAANEQRMIEEQARQAELERNKREIAQQQAEDKKRAEFESQFKPRAECLDPNIEWSKSVECSDEKMNAKAKFYAGH